MIKLFLTDVDGCLTDGVYQMSETGAISKNFHTHDFHGMWLLKNSGVKVGILSMSSDQVIHRQCDRAAPYAVLWTGMKDKLALVEEKYLDDYSWNEIAFVGDELFDMPLLVKVGLSACPHDAVTQVKDLLERKSDGLVLSRFGGRGCIREFADYVLNCNAGER